MKKIESGLIEYYVKGENPILLIISGMHGDEYSVIKPLTDYVKSHENNLPDFIFIPEASPSAVKQKTRENKFGNDLNRVFSNEAKDAESAFIMELCGKYSFDLVLSFHEDLETNSFYCYDSGKMPETQLTQLRDFLKQNDIKIFDGIDDPDDEYLGFKIDNGYISLPFNPNNIKPSDELGMWEWGMLNNVIRRIISLEIPCNIDQSKKSTLIEKIFSLTI